MRTGSGIDPGEERLTKVNAMTFSLGPPEKEALPPSEGHSLGTKTAQGE
jgi:hypothetical protein